MLCVSRLVVSSVVGSDIDNRPQYVIETVRQALGRA